jgi:hypothetical protein
LTGALADSHGALEKVIGVRGPMKQNEKKQTVIERIAKKVDWMKERDERDEAGGGRS